MPEEMKEKTEEMLADLQDDQKTKDIYHKIRLKVNSFKKERFQGKYGEVIEYLLLLPDFLALMVRLARDSRVETTQKLMIGGIIVYVVTPIDILPDFIPVIGFVDDLLLVVYGLNTILNEIDPEIVKEHWSGEEDLLEVLQKAISTAERFLSNNVINHIARIFNKLRKKGK